MMACSKVKPWLLWIVIAQAVFSGYWLKEPAIVSVISFVFSSIVYFTFVHVSRSTVISFPNSSDTIILLGLMKTIRPIFPL